jgi:hypothetical protein
LEYIERAACRPTSSPARSEQPGGGAIREYAFDGYVVREYPFGGWAVRGYPFDGVREYALWRVRQYAIRLETG